MGGRKLLSQGWALGCCRRACVGGVRSLSSLMAVVGRIWYEQDASWRRGLELGLVELS